MRSILFVLILASGCVGSPLEPADAYRTISDLARPPSAEPDRGGRDRQDSEAIRLRNAGFEPAEIIRRAGRTAIRATFTEPRLAFRMPGVTVERLQDGRVRLTLTSDGRSRTGSALIPVDAWRQLRNLEDAAFQPAPPPVPVGSLTGQPIEPRIGWDGCHGWGATLERIDHERAERVSAHGCDDDPLTRARLAYVARLAEIAVAAFPGCQERIIRGSDSLQKFSSCFGRFDPATTDDP